MRGVRAPVIAPVIVTPAQVLARQARAIEDQLSQDERVSARAKMIPFTSYFTTFGATENPISENGHWVSNGTNRTRIQTTGGAAFGTQTGSGGFDDSYARLTGVWAPDVQITATISKGVSSADPQEVELLFRVNDSPGSGNVTLYEMNLTTSGAWWNCYAWQGGIAGADFRQIGGTNVSGGVHDGDRIRGSVIGTTLTAEINYNDGAGWHQVFQVTDSQYATGTPGYGAYRETTSGASVQFGISDFYAAVML